MALYFSCGKTSGPKATRDYSPAPSALHGSQRRLYKENPRQVTQWFEENKSQLPKIVQDMFLISRIKEELNTALTTSPEQYCNNRSRYRNENNTIHIDHTLSLVANYNFGRNNSEKGNKKWSNEDQAILYKTPTEFLKWAEEALTKRSKPNAREAITHSFWHKKREENYPVIHLYKRLLAIIPKDDNPIQDNEFSARII